jgi:hypothetical protein
MFVVPRHHICRVQSLAYVSYCDMQSSSASPSNLPTQPCTIILHWKQPYHARKYYAVAGLDMSLEVAAGHAPPLGFGWHPKLNLNRNRIWHSEYTRQDSTIAIGHVYA